MDRGARDRKVGMLLPEPGMQFRDGPIGLLFDLLDQSRQSSLIQAPLPTGPAFGRQRLLLLFLAGVPTDGSSGDGEPPRDGADAVSLLGSRRGNAFTQVH